MLGDMARPRASSPREVGDKLIESILFVEVAEATVTCLLHVLVEPWRRRL